MNLSSKIEAVLFWKAEPITIKKLSVILDESEENIKTALNDLEKVFEGRGLKLMQKDDSIALATSTECSSLIEKLTKEELSRDIGKAGLETLSTILYYGPISRRDVDYVRGVNSAFVVRHLLVRGLIERVEDKKDQRVFMYKPTFEALAFLGVKKVEDLPDYEKVRKEFEAFVLARQKIEMEDGNKNAKEEIVADSLSEDIGQ